MFDTMTWVKIVGGFCGSLLVFLFANWAAHSIYFGEGTWVEDEQAYAIPVEGGEAAPAEEGAGSEDPPYAEVAATADAAAGEAVFAKCKACHKIDGTNATGPHLDGIVGRGHAEVADFAYSDAMMALKGEPWTPEVLYTFLLNPKKAIPGTKMGFAGLPKPQDRVNLIAYLETLK